MKLLLISVFLISIIFFISIPDVFGVTYLVNVPMGAAGGVGNFEPDVTKIQKGDTVKWTVFDRGKNILHTVTSDSGLFDSGHMERPNPPQPPPTFTYTFDVAGTYNYHCKIHSWMEGSVVVGELGYNAPTKSCSDVGCVYLDKKQYGVSAGRTVLVKIYGTVNDVRSNFVYMTIKEPGGQLSEQKFPVTSTGYFENPMQISYDKRGKYDVIVRGEDIPNGSQLGSVWFEVVKTSAMSQQKEITPTSIILNTDLQRYEKGSIIGIAGQLVPYQGGSSEVTIKVSSPNGNVVNIDQVQPSSIGTFSATVNTSNWYNEGNYEIKAKYENLIKSTTFAFTIPTPSSTSKTSTFLKLDSLDNTFKAKGTNSRADVTFSGQLLSADRKLFITGAPITLKFIGFTLDGKDHDKITTDDDGKFNEKFTMPIGKDYGIQAVFDGDKKFEPTKSQTEYFIVTLATSPPQPSPPQPSIRSSGVAGMEWIMILIPVIIIVVVVVAIKSRKKTSRTAPQRRTFGVKQPKKRRTGSPASVPPSRESASTFAHYECPNCHSENVVQNPNGSEYCSDCGWKS